MVEKIGTFRGQRLLVFGDRGDDGLDRLLPQLLGCLLHTGRKELRRPRFSAVRAGALHDDGLKPRQIERTHACPAWRGGSSRTGMPASAMCRLASAIV